MNPDAMKRRMRRFANSVIDFVESLPEGAATRVIGHQLIRCSTSVGANYRAACLGRSRADFIAKLKIAEEEADECRYWLELLRDRPHLEKLHERLSGIQEEADQLFAILVSSIRTTRRNENSP